jgi:hypothetical protein
MLNSFLDQLKAALSGVKSTIFYLSGRFRIYLNDNKNTAFIGLPVDTALSPSVLDLIKRVDEIFRNFDMDVFYDDPSPHCSLAFCANETGFASELAYHVIEPLRIPEEELDEFRIDVESVCVVIGNTLHTIHLAS